MENFVTKNKKNIIKNDVLSLLPHKYPFIFIDKIIYCNNKNYIQTLKNVSLNDLFMHSHFVNNPIFPGVHILEVMSQSAYILLKKILLCDSTIFFPLVKIQNAIFKRCVYPGDQMIINTFLKFQRHGLFSFQSIVLIKSKVIAKALIFLMHKN
ncbi:beta-hydroxyacyl-ACP dehydratase [Buchnera aphidicola (Thelaxes californica)]|uniref:Beta-hydroxyacyl-ACP dehydratase n=1 Tax=Buchnera aphidicola (Thelaxes californica) TaxID=1315998 RepID=A0A4D6YCA3_9GAMM|nr:3-hydroxyacyl-ACP dehydratase FabZ [Buchnera aphidicola]QCI26722.1 beta-hydroxyacyl-ACP dehydratase [Buchnera aphidicola (Thelaxes californica)]